MSMNDMGPKTVAVTAREGGEWIPFGDYHGNSVHAIMFADNAVWDVKNGWRTNWFKANSADAWLFECR